MAKCPAWSLATFSGHPASVRPPDLSPPSISGIWRLAGLYYPGSPSSPPAAAPESWVILFPTVLSSVQSLSSTGLQSSTCHLASSLHLPSTHTQAKSGHAGELTPKGSAHRIWSVFPARGGAAGRANLKMQRNTGYVQVL